MTKILPTTANGWVTLLGGIVFLIVAFFGASVYIANGRDDGAVLQLLNNIKERQDEILNDLRDIKGNVDSLTQDVGNLKVDTSELKIEVQWIKDLLPRPSAGFPTNR